MARSETQILGRELELGTLRGFVEGARSLNGLVLAGGPGIGKTTLWEAGIEAARACGSRVCSTRSSGAEMQLAFAGLIDLFDGIDLGALNGLSVPQRRALDVALLRADPVGAPPDPTAIALGLLNALRAMAKRRRVLLAIDDVQNLDPGSADALEFAARRLDGHEVRLLLSRRPGAVSGLEAASRPVTLDVGPLSLGAIRRMLSERLGLSLTRHALRRLVDSTLGNPLFALEIGRLLVERGPSAIDDELPVPETVDDLLGTRVAELRADERRVLLAVALSGELRTADLVGLVGPQALEQAVADRLVIVDEQRVRAAHPLLGAAAQQRSGAAEQRRLHLALSRQTDDVQQRARHLALAADEPDAEIAAIVAGAATEASYRGARREAVALGEEALRLTPPGSAERTDRLLSLADYLERAGESQRVTDLLTEELPSIERGSSRARAWLLLAEGAHIRHLDDYRRHLEHALSEASDDPALRARIVAKLSSAVVGVREIRRAEAEAIEVLPAARRAEPEAERNVLFALAWARGLQGRPVDEECRQFSAAADFPGYLAESPERVAAQRLIWRGEVVQARVMLERLIELADERGEPASYAWLRLHLCELALRIGDWAEADRLLDEWSEGSERDLFVIPVYQRCRALLAAGRGLPEEAHRWAEEAIAGAEAAGTHWDWLEALRARGTAALLAHDPERAVESFRPVWEHATREGVDEPGAFPVAPELVEALATAGKPAEARAVTARLLRLATEQQHPWGLTTASRCEALSAGDSDGSATELLNRAAAEYGELGLPFDRARSLLTLGRMHRRSRRWAAARDSLDSAADAFDRIGSPGWAKAARSELSRVGARRATPAGQLTEAEARVAGLAAAGFSNKEIAARLVVTVHTVEKHLSHAYAKLGVRSRGQLARRLRTSR
jgi:DNA-binding CsgD family transcriptional regulator